MARSDLHIDAIELVSSETLDMTELQEVCEEGSTSVYVPHGNVGWLCYLTHVRTRGNLSVF